MLNPKATAWSINDLYEHIEAKIAIPTYFKFVGTGTNLSPTAPAFEPITTITLDLPSGSMPKKGRTSDSGDISKYFARVEKAKEFIPNATAHGDDIKDAAKDINGITASPTLSTATTVTSSDISSTPFTWADEFQLENLLGREVTNELMNRLDPTKTLEPGPFLQTRPMTNPYERALTHEIIDRIYGERLVHETHGREKRMYLFVPGSRLPFWLAKQHRSRKRDQRKKAAGSSSASDGAAPIAARPEPARPMNAGWGAFAADTHTKYTAARSKDGYEEMRKQCEIKDEENKKPRDEPAAKIKQTFKLTSATETTDGKLGGPRKFINVERFDNDALATVPAIADTTNVPIAKPKTAVLPPHLRARAVTPPHLRTKSADAGIVTTGLENAQPLINVANGVEVPKDKVVWVAARLPSPCSSD